MTIEQHVRLTVVLDMLKAGVLPSELIDKANPVSEWILNGDALARPSYTDEKE